MIEAKVFQREQDGKDFSDFVASSRRSHEVYSIISLSVPGGIITVAVFEKKEQANEYH